MKLSAIRSRLFVFCLFFSVFSLVIVMCEWVVHTEANRRLPKGRMGVERGRLRRGFGFDRSTVCFGEIFVVASFAGTSERMLKIMYNIFMFDEK